MHLSPSANYLIKRALWGQAAGAQPSMGKQVGGISGSALSSTPQTPAASSAMSAPEPKPNGFDGTAIGQGQQGAAGAGGGADGGGTRDWLGTGLNAVYGYQALKGLLGGGVGSSIGTVARGLGGRLLSGARAIGPAAGIGTAAVAGGIGINSLAHSLMGTGFMSHRPDRPGKWGYGPKGGLMWLNPETATPSAPSAPPQAQAAPSVPPSPQAAPAASRPNPAAPPTPRAAPTQPGYSPGVGQTGPNLAAAAKYHAAVENQGR